MEEAYNILYRAGKGGITEKRSRFMAEIRPADTEEQALAFTQEVRKTYWDAGHHCFAYRIGRQNQIVRASDDGEPSQTAGKPILDVLAGRELHNVCAVVTRYFGGTLLGTGGLVRAYSQAVKEALKDCVILKKQPGFRLEVDTDYNSVGKIQYITAQMGITELEARYTDRAAFTYMVPIEELAALKSKLTEATAGRAVLRQGEAVYYGFEGKKLVLFEN